MEFLSRLPYTSLIGFLLIVIGAAISGATIYDSLGRIDKLFEKYFFEISNMDSVMLSSIIFIVVLLLISFFVLIFALIVTGATRHKIYRHNRCLFGGRRTAGFMMVLLFFVNICWLIVMCLNVIPVLGWLMVSSICRNELDKNNALKFTFSLTNFGFYPNNWFSNNPQSRPVNVNISDGRDFQMFCKEIYTIGSLFTCSFFGCILVLFGLVTSIASLSSLYMRLKYTYQLTGLIMAYEDQKTNELDYIVNSKAM